MEGFQSGPFSLPGGVSFPPSYPSGSNMGLPSSQASLSVRATLSDPDRSSGVSPFTTPLYWLPFIIQCRHLLNNVTRLNRFRDGATSLTAHTVPCVRLRRVVRHSHLLHNANTRYGWLAIPYPTRTSLALSWVEGAPCKRRQDFLGAHDRILVDHR